MSLLIDTQAMCTAHCAESYTSTNLAVSVVQGLHIIYIFFNLVKEWQKYIHEYGNAIL